MEGEEGDGYIGVDGVDGAVDGAVTLAAATPEVGTAPSPEPVAEAAVEAPQAAEAASSPDEAAPESPPVDTRPAAEETAAAAPCPAPSTPTGPAETVTAAPGSNWPLTHKQKVIEGTVAFFWASGHSFTPGRKPRHGRPNARPSSSPAGLAEPLPMVLVHAGLLPGRSCIFPTDYCKLV